MEKNGWTVFGGDFFIGPLQRIFGSANQNCISKSANHRRHNSSNRKFLRLKAPNQKGQEIKRF
jgi:hypothetical protein